MHLAGFKRAAPRGFTLAEMLVTVVILGIVAAVAVPLLSSGDSKKLDVAAEETANLLRFAMSEARRTGRYVLVDGITTPGQLDLYYSDKYANVPPTSDVSAINDPLTKLAASINPNAGAFSQGVAITPQFVAPDHKKFNSLLIGPAATQFWCVDKIAHIKGELSPGSGVLLSYGGQSVTININKDTGLVTLP